MCEPNNDQVIYIPISKKDYDKSLSDIQKHNQSILKVIIRDFEETRKILQQELGLPITNDENNNLKMIG